MKSPEQIADEIINARNGAQPAPVSEQTQSAPQSAAVLSTGQSANLLLRHIEGETLPNVEKAPGQTGRVTAFWLSYIKNTQLADKGMTGPMVAVWLCNRGFIELYVNDKVVKAGSPVQAIPSPEDLYGLGAEYAAVRPLPTNREFLQMIRAEKEAVRAKRA